MTKLVLFLSLLSLSGCISTSPKAWTQAPDEEMAAKSAIYRCQQEADGISFAYTSYGGAVAPILGLFARRDSFNRCMEANGYRP